MKPILLTLTLLSTLVATVTFAKEQRPGPDFYREFTKKVRNTGQFRVYMPNGQHQEAKYNFELGDPMYAEPIVNDMQWDPPRRDVLRTFWDRILLKDGSTLEIGGEKLPLTCIFISGQDNRFTKRTSPLTPEFIIEVYLVANDFSCQGPIHPGWPQSGGRKEAWDTYVHYEVRDPTIMQPMDARIRFRWNESDAIWIDAGKDTQ